MASLSPGRIIPVLDDLDLLLGEAIQLVDEDVDLAVGFCAADVTFSMVGSWARVADPLAAPAPASADPLAALAAAAADPSVASASFRNLRGF